MREPIRLIINADDYGYFACVSRGIVDAAQANAITATGIMATSPNLAEQLTWLKDVEVDIGVHLNLTNGQPLTQAMRDKLGEFPNAYKITGLVLAGKLSLNLIKQEWYAQIEACQSQKLVFLNSHEHIHALPVLFSLTLELAKHYNIAHVRLPQADWLPPFTGAGLMRNSLITGMQMFNQLRLNKPVAIFLGLSRSGKLDYATLKHLFSKLKAGQCYELMCHVGQFDAAEITDTRLLAYHDWQAELDLLKSPQLQDLYQQFNIQLSHYD